MSDTISVNEVVGVRRILREPGPMGDVTPEARALRDETRQYRDQAASFSASTRTVQDEAVSALVASGAATGPAVDARVLAHAGQAHVLSLQADLQGEEAKALARGTLAYVVETDAWYVRGQSADAWYPVVTAQRRWAGAMGDGGSLRAVVYGHIGQVQCLALPVGGLVQGATLDTGLTVPEGMRPTLDHAIARLTADVSSSLIACTLEVRSDTGRILIRNRGGAAVTGNTLSGSLTWLVES